MDLFSTQPVCSLKHVLVSEEEWGQPDMAALTWNAMALWRTGSSWTPTLGRQYLPAPRLQWGLYGSGSNTWGGWRGERLAGELLIISHSYSRMELLPVISWSVIDAPYLTGRDTDGSGQLQATQTTVDSGVNSSFIAKYLTILEL